MLKMSLLEEIKQERVNVLSVELLEAELLALIADTVFEIVVYLNLLTTSICFIEMD